MAMPAIPGIVDIAKPKMFVVYKSSNMNCMRQQLYSPSAHVILLFQVDHTRVIRLVLGNYHGTAYVDLMKP